MTINVKEFGAVGDGIALDQKAIQEAINRCSKNGGGTVYIPAGTYKSGMLSLCSDLNLHLESGARIVAADDQSLYPVLGPTPFGNLPGHIQTLIYAKNLENISLTGNGIIHGNGNKELWGEQTTDASFRPALVFIDNCTNVAVHNIKLLYSQYWTLHLKRCLDVSLKSLTIRSHHKRINADGIDPDGCRNVTISDCIVETGDDALVFKSTDGAPCENISVTNCILKSSCQAIKFGTESLGPMRNITISNCIISDSERAITMFLKDKGPYENIMLSNIIAEARNELPFVLDITPRNPDESRPESIRNVFFDNIRMTGPGRILLEGKNESPLENISFNDFTWYITGTQQDFSHHKKSTGTARAVVDPDAENYLENPYQFVAVNIKDLHLKNMSFADTRPAENADRGSLYLRKINRGSIENISPCPVPAEIPESEIHECVELVMKGKG